MILQQVRERRVIAIQERVAAIEDARRNEELAERKRALVSARVDREASPRGGTDWFLVLENEGRARALNVSCELSGGIDGDPPGLLSSGFPLPFLHAGQEYRVDLVAYAEGASAFVAKVAWEDQEGSKSEDYLVRL